MVARIQGATVSGSQSLAFSGAVVPGSLLIAVVRNGNYAPPDTNISVSDSVNGAWTTVMNQPVGANDILAIAYKANTAAGTPTVSWSATTPGFSRFIIEEYGPMASDAAPYASNSATAGQTTTFSSGAVTVSGDTLAIGGAANEATSGVLASDSPWATQDFIEKVIMAHQISPANGSLTYTGTATGETIASAGAIALFSIPAGGAADTYLISRRRQTFFRAAQ